MGKKRVGTILSPITRTPKRRRIGDRRTKRAITVFDANLGNAEKRAYVNLISFADERSRIMDRMRARVAGTVVAFFGWLAFIVLYLAFFAGNLTFWQSLAVFIASGAIVIAIVAVAWISWTLK